MRKTKFKKNQNCNYDYAIKTMLIRDKALNSVLIRFPSGLYRF